MVCDDGHFVSFAPSPALHCMPPSVRPRLSPKPRMILLKNLLYNAVNSVIWMDLGMKAIQEPGDGPTPQKRPARCYAGLFGLAPPFLPLSPRLPKPGTAPQAAMPCSHLCSLGYTSAHHTRAQNQTRPRERIILISLIASLNQVRTLSSAALTSTAPVVTLHTASILQDLRR